MPTAASSAESCSVPEWYSRADRLSQGWGESPVSQVRRASTARLGGASPLPKAGGGLTAMLRLERNDVTVVVRPVLSEMPPGTTLRVELLAEYRGSELRADVTAEQEAVHARVWQDGVHCLERGFNAPRRTDVDLLAEAIEAGRRDDIAIGTLREAGELAGGAIQPAAARPAG